MTNEARLVRALNSATLELSQEFVAGTFDNKPLWAYESLFETYADHFKKMVSHEASMNVVLDLAVAHLNIKWVGHRCYFIDDDGAIDWHAEQIEESAKHDSVWDTSMCMLDFDKMRRHVEFTEGNKSSSNNEGSK